MNKDNIGGRQIAILSIFVEAQHLGDFIPARDVSDFVGAEEIDGADELNCEDRDGSALALLLVCPEESEKEAGSPLNFDGSPTDHNGGVIARIDKEEQNDDDPLRLRAALSDEQEFRHALKAIRAIKARLLRMTVPKL